MLQFFSFQLLLPTLPIFLSNNGSSRAAVGIVTGVIMMAAVFSRPFTGYALDYMHRKRVVLTGSSLFTVSFLAYAVSDRMEWVLFASILLGLGWGITTISNGTMVADLIPARRQGAGIGTFMLFGLVSTAVAPLIGGRLIAVYGSCALFGTAFLIGVGALLISLFLSFKRPGTAKTSGLKTPLLTSIFETTAWLPALFIFLFTVCYGGILSFVNLFGQELGLENPEVFFFLSNGTAILIRPIAGKLFDKKGYSMVLVPGILIGIVAMIVLASAADLLVFASAAVLYGLSFGTVQPSIMAWTIQRVTSGRRGSANGMFMIGMDCGIVAGSVMLGWIAQQIGYANMYRDSALILIMLFLLYAATSLRQKKQR